MFGKHLFQHGFKNPYPGTKEDHEYDQEMEHLFYEDRLRHLGLLSVEKRGSREAL